MFSNLLLYCLYISKITWILEKSRQQCRILWAIMSKINSFLSLANSKCIKFVLYVCWTGKTWYSVSAWSQFCSETVILKAMFDFIMLSASKLGYLWVIEPVYYLFQTQRIVNYQKGLGRLLFLNHNTQTRWTE